MQFLNIFIVFFVIRKCSSTLERIDAKAYYKMPPLFGLEDYESCLSEADGTYCLVRLDLHAEKDNELMQFITEYSKYKTKHYNHTNIDRGVCVTKSCKHLINKQRTDVDLENLLEVCLNEKISKEYGLQTKISTVYYCDKPQKKTDKDTADLIVLAIFILIFLVNIVGSLYDILEQKSGNKNHKTGNPYLLSFSIIRNWTFLVETQPDKQDPRIVRFKGFNGVRSVPSFLLIIAHVMWIFCNGYADNPLELEHASEKFQYQLIFNGMMVVQIYFVLSGIFMAYNLMIEAEKQRMTWDLVPKAFIYRWWRLTPPYALMIAFTATWLRFLGSGPLWNLYVIGVVNDCRRYWWAHLLYINNYLPDDKFCAVQSWHLAADTQAFLVGLLIHFVTIKRHRIKTMVITIVISMMAPAFHVWWEDLDALVIMRPEFYRTFYDDNFRHLHILGHNNMTCFFIGMCAGYLIYEMQKRNVDCTNVKILKYLQWTTIPCFIALYQTGQFFNQEERKSLALRMVYAGTLRGVLGVVVAFCCIGLVMKFEDALRSIFEWRGWLVMSKLSYGMFLLHVNLIHFIMGTRTQLVHISFFNVCLYHLGVVLFTYIMAVPFYLMIEAPCNRLWKIIISRHLTLKKKVT